MSHAKRSTRSDPRVKKLLPTGDEVTPVYLQLARKLGESIQRGEWERGEALPAERVLCEELNVSRVTLRMAFEAVEEQGLISRRQGAGTFVTPHIEHALTSLTSFSETLRRKGYEPGTQWLERETRVANADEVVRLGLSPGTEVAALVRLRSADGKVIAFERSALPAQVVPQPNKVGDSLYRWLDEHGTPVVRALQYFRAANLSKRLAQHLGMTEGTAILRVVRVGYGREGAAIELTETYCNGDYYDFVAELKR
jgi:GntR family transcriptional regulator